MMENIETTIFIINYLRRKIVDGVIFVINQIYVIKKWRIKMSATGMIYALRLKLSDFINTEFESIVIDKINEVNGIATFKLQLWYDEGEVKPAELKSFMQKYESLLHYKTTIRPNRDADHAQFTWYDIIHEEDITLGFPYRFQYKGTGDRISSVLKGLMTFKSCLEFIMSDKTSSRQDNPHKQDKSYRHDKSSKRKQKRNDYED